MKNKPKQTAVDYLFAKMEALRGLFLFEEIDYNTYVDEKKEAFKKAKEIEKQQIIETAMNCFCEGKYSAEFTEKKINSSELINYAKEYFEQVYNENTNN
jgi:hypothetical protein